MGKQRRKKRQSNNNNNKKKNDQNKSSPNKSNNEPSSTLLQRIRHSDPRTRHAALAAVANTMLDPSSNTRLPKSVTSPLLQAIRERVLDSDLDVCQVAAGCLANCVQIVAASSDDNTTTSQNQAATPTLTAGWTLVLMGRLKQCHDHVVVATTTTPPAKNNNNNNNNQQKKVQKQWLALAVQCWKTLCVLTETNPEAVGRLTSQLDATPRREFHQVLLEWMQHCCGQSTTSDDTAQYYEQIMTLSARTLHSAWDDNADLLLPWKEECPDAFRHALELLTKIVTVSPAAAASTGFVVPVVAQLHCAGAILAARPLMTTQQAVQVTQETVLPHLLHNSTFSWDTAQSILQAYQQAHQAWEQEQADDALERDVIRKVEDRKEPARLIARRQKEKKKADKAMEEESEDKKDEDKKEDANKDSTMEEGKEEEEKAQQQTMETREALEEARDAWNQFLLPLQLSLELVANLTGRNSLEEDDDNDNDMMEEEDWGPDQEAKWMQQEQQRQMQTSLPNNKDEDALQKILLESALPKQLVQLFRQVYHQQQTQGSTTFPETSKEDLEDLQSKTMACLGNCWDNIPAWSVELTWPELQQAATTATGAGKAGLVSAMVIALKTYPSLRKQWQPEHVTFWLNELAKNDEDAAVRRDIISMLGILCSQEPHPAEVNQKICSTLLGALTKDTTSVMIPCEVLSVLMDMYGNDEDDGCCHVSVFESLQVLGHFQRNIPVLKSKLKQLEKNNVGDLDRADLELWKETVLNASRFIQYKKGQL
ncbi:ribosomal large subunit biogenesis [Seminavis robusta]|uniref:Ribosomal large subunit biogenesis n=1 Tax=Seminavis robusta TaxID=568900 RepID=A0A9N8HQS5_9STRA|nr:ribosomal large subunit biogenesis [Seminavis robusta]|eukprot:Sro1479_g276080.1 ribosomal large subunit biogenesis (766) ;mRNA; f:13292-15589